MDVDEEHREVGKIMRLEDLNRPHCQELGDLQVEEDRISVRRSRIAEGVGVGQ